MKLAMLAFIASLSFAGSAFAANKYEYKAPAKSYSAPSRPATPSRAVEHRQQDYKRQDRQNDNRRQDTYRAQQNRVVTDSIKKKNAERSSTK